MARTTTEIPNTLLQRQMQLVSATPGSGLALYAFYVVDLKTGRIVRRFGFDVPPMSMKMSEDAAAEAAATQDGGFYAEERGQFFKMLAINGTFGFRPTPIRGVFQGVLDAVTNLQAAERQVATGLTSSNAGLQDFPKGERTGFDQLRDLTNIFRFYWDMKMERSTRARYVFIWADWKFGEVYFAQPLSLERDRTAPSGRVKATYSVRLRLLTPVQVTKPPDFLTVNTNMKSWESRWNQAKGLISMLAGSVKLISAVANAALDFGFSITKEILKPINEMIGALEGIVSGAGTAIGKGLSLAQIPMTGLQIAHRYCLEAAVVARQARGFEQLGADLMRSARLVGGAWASLIDVVVGRDVNSEARNVGKNYKNWDANAALNSAATPNGSPVGRSWGSTDTTLGTRKIPDGSQRIVLPGGVSIKGFAAQYLGDSGRWKELVLLNRLKPPYISEKGDGVTVLRPGDMINVPTIPETGNDENQVFRNVSGDEDPDIWKYGRDLMVDLSTRELVVSDKGDLSLVGGLDNLRQAMHLKIWRVPGDLKVHPWYGFGVEGGEGLAVDTLAGYHLQLRTTLLSDSRVDEVKSMVLTAIGDVLHIRALIVPKDSDDSITLETRAPTS